MIFALGAFDGFHMGHRQLLCAAEERANKLKTGWGVITFEGHPQQFFNREAFKFLFTPEERTLLSMYLAVPVMEKIPFTRALADMMPEAFLEYIALRNKIDGLVVGSNFRFGRARTGTPELLTMLCKERGWSLDVIPSYTMGGNVVSSTAIRELILRGNMENACKMLGHPYIIQGKIIKGDGRGRTLGFPTANMGVKTGKVYPGRGSYTALAHIGGIWYPAALNMGYNPTFDGVRSLRCETHIIGFGGDIYGMNLTVFLTSRNRDEMKFGDADELKAQLEKDIRAAEISGKKYLAQNQAIIDKFGTLPL